MSRVLLTNDDGVWAPGLQLLRACAEEVFDEVQVVAPSSEMSGVSQGLTLHAPLRMTEMGPNTWRVGGTPADCVIVAMGSVFENSPPDLVLSGVNRGPNLGRDVYYSGTCAGAREGLFHGIPAVALSLVGRDRYPFEAFSSTVTGLLRWIGEHHRATTHLLNINIPVTHVNGEAGAAGLKDARFTRLGNHSYDNSLVHREDPRGRPYLWIGGKYPELEDIEGTDCHAVQHGHISITPVGVDLTNLPALSALRETSGPGPWPSQEA